jgi:hypothetical protein
LCRSKKRQTDYFGGDAYHVPWSHLSAVKTSFSSGVTIKPTTIGAIVSPGNGHGLICIGPEDVGEPPMPEMRYHD